MEGQRWSAELLSSQLHTRDQHLSEESLDDWCCCSVTCFHIRVNNWNPCFSRKPEDAVPIGCRYTALTGMNIAPSSIHGGIYRHAVSVVRRGVSTPSQQLLHFIANTSIVQILCLQQLYIIILDDSHNVKAPLAVAAAGPWAAHLWCMHSPLKFPLQLQYKKRWIRKRMKTRIRY